MSKRLYLMAFAALSLPRHALAAEPSKPQLLNLEELVSADDYPKVSQRNGDEGTVVVEASVDRDGLVSSCRIKSSSGHVALDEQTCALFRARARFEPARDRRGRAVASTYERMVVWRLEGEMQPPLPRQAWRIVVKLSFGTDGKIVGCDAQSTGLPTALASCPPQDPEAIAASAGTKPITVAQRITETYFFPVAAAKAIIPPSLTEGSKIAHQVSELIIDPDGRVGECTAMRYSGLAGPELDHCKLIRTMHFAPGAAGPLTGTVVVTEYFRKESVT